MDYPSFTVSSIDCNCPDIKYKVVINFEKDQSQEAIIESFHLLPFIGRVLELINTHRLTENKKNENKEETS